MICLTASYRDFRNITEEKLIFSPEVNLICGKNAQGKTNSLEGIFLMANGKSFRAARERELIRFGTETAKVKISYRDVRRESELGMEIHRSGRRVCTKNGVNIRKMSEFIGNFHAVLFTPEHLSIVKDGPALRRGFLDGALCQLSPGYLAALQAYNRILLQRNKLLSDIADSLTDPRGSAADTLEIWTDRLIQEAVRISAAREEYTLTLNTLVGGIFSDMTDDREKVAISYYQRRSAEEYRKEYENVRIREMRTGSTHFGVHKDDLEITLNENSVRSYGSQGQQRSVALAMKIAEGEIAKSCTGEYPVFLFDDILSELDDLRRSYILSGISGRQVLITACDMSAAPGANVIRCDSGKFEGGDFT